MPIKWLTIYSIERFVICQRQTANKMKLFVSSGWLFRYNMNNSNIEYVPKWSLLRFINIYIYLQITVKLQVEFIILADIRTSYLLLLREIDNNKVMFTLCSRRHFKLLDADNPWYLSIYNMPIISLSTSDHYLMKK